MFFPVLQMWKWAAPSCCALQSHREQASQTCPFKIIFNLLLKLVVNKFWHFYWLFQMKTQQQYKKAVSAIQLPNITSRVRLFSKPCHQSFPSLMGMGGWFVFLKFSTAKFWAHPSFRWNDVSSYFCSTFRTWINWNHQFPMTTGKKPHKECDFFCLFFNRNKQIEIYYFFFQRSIVHVHIIFGLAENSHNLVEGVGLDWAVFQWVLVLVIFKSLLSNLSHRLKLTANTIRKFLWPKYGAQGISFALVQGFLNVKCHQIN